MTKLLNIIVALWRVLWNECPNCTGMSVDYCMVCKEAEGRVEMWRRFRLMVK